MENIKDKVNDKILEIEEEYKDIDNKRYVIELMKLEATSDNLFEMGYISEDDYPEISALIIHKIYEYVDIYKGIQECLNNEKSEEKIGIQEIKGFMLEQLKDLKEKILFEIEVTRRFIETVENDDISNENYKNGVLWGSKNHIKFLEKLLKEMEI